jgi:hypothetical protein
MAQNSGLDKRLSALEQIAEEVRLRPIRALAVRRGLSPDRVLELYEQVRSERRRLQAAGMTEREILEASAARMGITPDELRRRSAALVAELEAEAP